jgi:hypothetical protein
VRVRAAWLLLWLRVLVACAPWTPAIAHSVRQECCFLAAAHPQDDEDGPAVLAGYGYGLPISRLYARYFGGDLQVRVDVSAPPARVS